MKGVSVGFALVNAGLAIWNWVRGKRDIALFNALTALICALSGSA